MPSHRPSDSRQQPPTPRGPGRFFTVGLLMMALATGCGVEPEETEGSQPEGTASTGAPQAAPEEEGNVSAQAACCYIRCADGADNGWRGPYASVVYDNCANYGRYACGQHYWSYLSHKWAGC